MPTRQLTVGFLCFSLLCSTFFFVAAAQAQKIDVVPVPDTVVNPPVTDPCDPSTIGISRINPYTDLPFFEKPETTNTSLRATWCFTMEGALDKTAKPGENDGKVLVHQHIVLWEISNAGQSIQDQSTTELTCKKSGSVNWLEDEGFVHFNGGKISCRTLDLRQSLWDLSDGQLDICNGVMMCEIPISNVINYLNIPVVDCPDPSPSGNSLFNYEEVRLGFGQKTAASHPFIMQLNGQDFRLDLPNEPSIGKWEIAIEQRGGWFDFAVNDVQLPSQQASTPITYFESNIQTIHLGYNPETQKHYEGCFGDSILDPHTGPSFWGD